MKIINIGSLNYDRVYRLDHFVEAGETVLADGYDEFLGGKGLNQSTALSRAGATVFHAGAVGPDGNGLVDFLREVGVNTELIKQVPTVSGHAIIQNAKGANNIIVFGGANQCLTETDIDVFLSVAEPGDLLLLQNETSAVPYAMKKAKEKGLRIAFNASPITEALLEYPLDLVDIFLVNEVEGKILSKCESTDFGEILAALHKRFPEAEIVLTIGEAGVLCQSGEKTVSQKAFPTVVVDTTAAGDTFIGYYLAERVKGSGIETALTVASLAAGYSVGKAGAAPSIPSRSEVEEYKKLFSN